MSPRIILIDSDQRRANDLSRTLFEAGFLDVTLVDPRRVPIDSVAGLKPDLIVMDMSLPDRDALESVRSLATNARGPIVVFSNEDDPAFVAEAIAAGVSSYNLAGVSSRDMRLILASAIAIYRRQANVESELAAATAALAERRLIERAKAALMARRKLSEPQAYRWLRNKAMNESRKIAEVAASVVAEIDAEAKPAKQDPDAP